MTLPFSHRAKRQRQFRRDPAIEIPSRQVPDEDLGHARLQLGVDPSRDGPAIVPSDRERDGESALARAHVPTPAGPQHGVSLPDQKAVAGVLQGGGDRHRPGR